MLVDLNARSSFDQFQRATIPHRPVAAKRPVSGGSRGMIVSRQALCRGIVASLSHRKWECKYRLMFIPTCRGEDAVRGASRRSDRRMAKPKPPRKRGDGVPTA